MIEKDVISIEIGGYMEFPKFSGNMLHQDAILLNCARNCLAYLIEAKGIKKILLPKFLCASVSQICKNYNLKIRYYSITSDFCPIEINVEEEEWFYLVNYYGQINNDMIKKIKKKHNRIIVDNVQAYFQMPIKGVDTIYSCRKYFGVPDGALLYTDTQISRGLEQDKSVERMKHLFGRYEKSASEYYLDYLKNENTIDGLTLRYMSKITRNLLCGIDYENVKLIRERNYLFLSQAFSSINRLTLEMPVGPFMYPLYLSEGNLTRKKMQKKGIYISTLWTDVFDICSECDLEYKMAQNIMPLPCDQRYELEDVKQMVDIIMKII